MKRLFLLMVLSGFCIPAFTKQDTTIEKKAYDIAKLSTNPPVIDGMLDDPGWQEAAWEGNFVQHMPYSGKAPTFETRFKMTYDDDFIYVAIESFDPATDSIVTRMTRRDELDGDMVFVDFDSYHDLRTAFAFAVTAGGVKGDYLISEDGNNNDPTWDPVWWVKTSIGRNSWIAEMKIPFSQLRFDNSGTGIWGLELGRELYRKNEISFWQHIPADAPGIIHLFGELHGMKDVSPSKQAEVIPYLTSGVKNYEEDPEDPFLDGRGYLFNGGVDAKLGLTNNLTLDLSLNPDFGQVEADPSQVNLTAYESFFQEKRPLFIEGKNIYNFPLRFGDGGMGAENLFYSRRIGRSPHHYPDVADNEFVKMPEQTNIIAAAKLSGKSKNGTSIGILETITAEESAVIDNEGDRRKITVEPLTNYFVGRMVQDLNDGNTILGGIFTSTYRDIKEPHLNFLPVSSTTGGIDFQQYWGNKGYNVKFVNYFSHVTGSEESITDLQRSPAHLYQRPDVDYVELDSSRTSLTGFGGNLQLWKTSGNFNFLAAAVWKSPGLELNDLGFFRMGDEIMEVLWVGYNIYEPFSIFRRLSVNMDHFSGWDFGGNLALSGFEAGGMAMFKNFWNVNFHFNIHGDVRYNSYLRGGPSIILPGKVNLMAVLNTDVRKKLVFGPSVRIERGFLDHSKETVLGLKTEYRPINALNLSIEPEMVQSNSMLQYVDQQTIAGTDRYIFASIDQNILLLSIRANLTLTPELTLQYWGQPFIACGDFYDYKYITSGLDRNFEDRYHAYSSEEIVPDELHENYVINETGSSLPVYSFANPDFKVREFLSNLVIRWEYRPGSFVYAVWSQNRNGYNTESEFNFGSDISYIWNIKPTNVFLLKLSYRIGR